MSPLARALMKSTQAIPPGTPVYHPPVPTRVLVSVFVLLVLAPPSAQQLSESVRRDYVKVDAPVVALTNARVIDGTGAPARAGQTLILRDGNIAAIGAAGSVAVPEARP